MTRRGRVVLEARLASCILTTPFSLPSTSFISTPFNNKNLRQDGGSLSGKLLVLLSAACMS